MEGILHGIEGYMYPNEIELQWSVLIVLYPFITGLVAGAFILASLERVLRVEAGRPTHRPRARAPRGRGPPPLPPRPAHRARLPARGPAAPAAPSRTPGALVRDVP